MVIGQPTMAAADFGKVGFIGLGAMGKPMAQQLATKLSRIFVFDVIEDAMHDFAAQFPGKVFPEGSAKDVALKSVNHSIILYFHKEKFHLYHI